MPQHYPACLTMHKLHLSVKLGRWDEERARRQPVEVSVKFFFPALPSAALEDTAQVMCYDALSAALAEYAEGKEFRHIEYLTVQLYHVIRDRMRRQTGDACDAVKILVRLHKCNAPIPALTGGASFVYTDLPEGLARAAGE